MRIKPALISIALLLFGGLAYAQTTVPDPGANPGDFLEQSFAAIRGGNWTIVVAFALVGAVWVARQKWALGRFAFFATDRGGVLLAFGVSLVGGFGHALAATGHLPDLDTIKTVVTTAITAMGGYTAIKRLIWPKQVTEVAPPLAP